ncbi:GNAT family N-acetyltransferase [Alkaliphilus hydrothermalis]|uniref:GNAT superfamily N-acetyltransferase n=1 Tax=Alkaliphilus hydrothermalis TaxID=1482730 RepID=A0ABS2NTI0_9FIRM|nr:GNAT family N-acetyltransferase [Alkaliphilus hydrothermalis]MBM7615879.1 GNAT superfamily N-acetyltransferase [Alkaliphilus hydrothermalis]
MELLIKRTNLDEVEELLEIQKSAFHEALERYQDYDTSPATEAKERLQYKIQHYHHYTIYMDDELIGGAEVRIKSVSHCYLNRIYVNPTHQGKGIGKKVMLHLEGLYPQATTWSLNTPHMEYRNHYLYEKMGYRKIGEEAFSDKMNLFYYEKVK